MHKISVSAVAKILIPILLIMVITMWAYYPTTNNLFVWDSKEYLFDYEFWISKLSAYHIIWMFSSFEVMNWHPLTWLSWAFDFKLYGGLDPWGFHLTNNILHSINSALVYLLALVVFGLNNPGSKGFPIQKDNHALMAAFLAALLFAVHPQHVESVAWVAERKDLLVQLFLLLSMLAYVKYVTCNKDVKRRWFGCTLGLFLLALLSKPMAVTFPVVLLLIDVYPLRRINIVQPVIHSIEQKPFYGLLREKTPFILLSALSVLITLFAQQGALTNVSIDLRVLNAFNSVIFYLTKFWIPTNFAPIYPYYLGAESGISWADLVPVLSVLGLTIASVFAWTRGRHAWLIAWLFYLVTLSPVLGLIQVGQQGAADRYAYFPTLPIYILIGAAVLAVLNRTTPTKRLLVLLAALTVVFLLTGKTRQQIQVWKNDQTIWSHEIMLFPTNALAHLNLGGYYFNVQSYEKAAIHFKEAARWDSKNLKAIAWFGLANLHLGRYEDAITAHVQLGSAIEHYPELSGYQYCIQYNIGWIFAKMNMFTESSELFRRVDPNSSLGHEAGIWLNWLETSEQTGNTTPSNEDLPGFCSKLVPPR